MPFALSIARLLLICVFTVAGLAKLADLPGSRQAFLDFGVPPTIAATLAGFVIWNGQTNVGFDGISWLFSLTIAQLLALSVGILLFVLVVSGTSYLLRWQMPLLSWIHNDAIRQTTLGLPPNTLAPAFHLTGLSGKEQTLQTFCMRGKPVLLIFADPDCRSCNALLPQIARWQHAYVSQLTIILLSRGSLGANQERSTHYGVTDIVLQKDREVALAYQAEITPAAILVNTDGTIGSPLAVGAKAISDLIMGTVESSSITPVVSGPCLRHDLVIENKEMAIRAAT